MRRARLALAVLAVGVGAGLAGAVLTLLLHVVQHLAYGYVEGAFLVGAQRAPGWRRVAAMASGGVLVGCGWALLRRGPIPSVTAALRASPPALPLGRTVVDACLQIVAVGAGASLGREGAPRQVGAALANRSCALLDVAPSMRRVLVACGAGAGLAAVYDVPLSGVLFTLEVLLKTVAPRAVVPAAATAAIATLVARPVVTTAPTYLLPPAPDQDRLVVWALLAGPLLGLVGFAFGRLARAARVRAPHGWRLPIATTVGFTAVGLVAVAYPEVLGNGKGPAQLAFAGALGVPTVGVLLLLKPLATTACFRSGAVGGLLTPAVAVGALAGVLLGAPWAEGPATAYAVVGAGAVLAVTQDAPLTATALALELTRAPWTLLVPVLLAVSGAVSTAHLLGSRRTPGVGPALRPVRRDDNRE